MISHDEDHICAAPIVYKIIVYKMDVTDSFCLFNLILYVPDNNFSVKSKQVFLGRTSTKQG